MKKIKFPKTYEDVEVGELGIQGADGVVFRFWNNPSKHVVNNILAVVGAKTEDLLGLPEHKIKEIDEKYQDALIALLMDCNIEGVDLDTREGIDDAFENPDLPIGFLHEVVVGYVTKLLQENDRVKKAAALFLAQSGFGEEEKQRDSA